MDNPFLNLGKPEGAEPVTEWEDVEGRFGCFTDGCGRVTGDALYNESTKELKFTCPSGHVTSMRYDL